MSILVHCTVPSCALATIGTQSLQPERAAQKVFATSGRAAAVRATRTCQARHLRTQHVQRPRARRAGACMRVELTCVTKGASCDTIQMVLKSTRCTTCDLLVRACDLLVRLL